jgi:rRNA-processing protein EBP2
MRRWPWSKRCARLQRWPGVCSRFASQGKIVKKKKSIKINNTAALTSKCESVRLPADLPWIETMVLTSEGVAHDAVDVNHDLNRELAFYGQAKEASQFSCLFVARRSRFGRQAMAVGLERLREANVPVERPTDYFAEMVKTDEHMEFIRSRLAKQKERLERIETKKKDAELKKFGRGKQKLQKQEKQREKKQEIESVKAWSRKRKANNTDGGATEAELEALISGKKKKSKNELLESVRQGSQTRGNKKKDHKLEKFASNTRRKSGWKKNDAESVNGGKFDVRRNKTPFQKPAGKSTGGKKKAKAPTRPGKARRKEQVIRKNKK